jgi:cytochrome c oxidase cbb3-type subunit 3
MSSPSRSRVVAAGSWALVLALIAFACDREERAFRSAPPALAGAGMARQSTLEPGGPLGVGALGPAGPPEAEGLESPWDQNAWGVSEGKRLFTQWNCVGCHAQGGGGIGPALMDTTWRYGGDPRAIYESIVLGRPGGMPSFGGRISAAEAWQLVSYVRGLSGQLQEDVRSGRQDHMQVRLQDQGLPTLRSRGSEPREE